MAKIWTWLPQVIVILVLLWAFNPHNRYWYYVLVRWVCCGAFALLAFQAFAQKKHVWGCVLGIAALAYNPIIPLHSNRVAWSIINTVTIGIALASLFFAVRGNLGRGKEKQDCQKNDHAE